MSAIWDILQHVQINKAKNAAEVANTKVDALSARRDTNKHQVDELTLACQAMWELLRDRLGVTDDELKAKILEVDARDGVVDGKLGAEVLACPSCGQKVSTSAQRCAYCGHNTPSGRHVMK